MRGVKMGKNVWISKLVYIDEIHPECVSIGDNSTIGFRTTIYAHTYFGRRKPSIRGNVIIGKNVFIGPHCLILPNVTIGDNAVIKGGSVITHSIPANTMWGPPSAQMIARVTVPLTHDKTYTDFVMGLRPVKKKQPAANKTNNLREKDELQYND
jgi:acetyltransferase-like isoleucine patch superfamily enzyme